MANEAHKRLMRAFDDAVESLVGELGEESAEFKDKRQQARGNIAKNKVHVRGPPRYTTTTVQHAMFKPARKQQ